MTVSSVPGLNLGGGQFYQPGPVSDPSAALGQISAQQWGTYMQHFVPMENQLIQYAMDPTLVAKNMQTAEQTQEQASAQAAGIETRGLAQRDVTMTPTEKAASERTRGITAAGATVTAANKAKDVTVANQMGILGAPMSGITGQL